MKRFVLTAAFLLVAGLGYGAWYAWGPGGPPAGQEAIVEINAQSLEQFRTAFNAAADHPRMIALLSPT